MFSCATAAGDAEAAAEQEAARKQKQMDAANIQAGEQEDDQDDAEGNGDDQDNEAPVPETIAGLQTHKCRSFASLLKELGDFTEKGEGDNFQIAAQGLNVMVYFDEALAMRSPLQYSDGFSDGPFVISPWLEDDPQESDADGQGGDAKKPQPEAVKIPELIKHIANAEALASPSEMKMESFKLELEGGDELESASENATELKLELDFYWLWIFEVCIAVQGIRQGVRSL